MLVSAWEKEQDLSYSAKCKYRQKCHSNLLVWIFLRSWTRCCYRNTLHVLGGSIISEHIKVGSMLKVKRSFHRKKWRKKIPFLYPTSSKGVSPVWPELALLQGPAAQRPCPYPAAQICTWSGPPPQPDCKQNIYINHLIHILSTQWCTTPKAAVTSVKNQLKWGSMCMSCF